MNKEKIAGFISRLRKDKGMTQKDLAQRLNVTDKAVSKWERGQGYPDITIVTALAEELGVSVGELLNGERAAGPDEPPADSDSLIKTTLEYAQTVEKQRQINWRSVASLTVSFSFLIAVFVCVLCDFVITGEFTWSLYVIGSCVLGWAVSLPLIHGKKYRFLLSLACLTVLILPFLLLVESLTPAKGWIASVAVPSALVLLGYLWLLGLLHTFTHIRPWFLGAAAAFLLPALNIPINLWINRFVGNADDPLSTVLSVLSALVLGIGLLAGGVISRKKACD